MFSDHTVILYMPKIVCRLHTIDTGTKPQKVQTTMEHITQASIHL